MNASGLIMQTTVAGNELWRIIILFLILFVSFLAGKLLSAFLLALARRREQDGAMVAAAGWRALGAVSPLVLLTVGLQVVLRFDVLILGDGIAGVAETTVSILFVIAVAWTAYRLVDVADRWLMRLASRAESKMDNMLVPLVRKSLRITIVILAIMQVATVLSDKPVTSLLAGLGIGSIAIGLGAQDTLKNFFGSIMILADKPFEIGDRIIVGETDGPVEEIGFRSTRIRTLEGHLVTVPNSDMANRAVKNIGKRPNIRKLFTISITYDTPPDKVEQALSIVKDVLKDHEGQHEDFPPRIYFDGFGDCSLNILVIYWYHPPNYWDFMVFNERMNLEILKRFNEAGIEFAFPTRTLYLAGDPRRPLDIGTRTQV